MWEREKENGNRELKKREFVYIRMGDRDEYPDLAKVSVLLSFFSLLPISMIVFFTSVATYSMRL